MLMKIQTRLKQRGISLLEVMLSLAIIAIILVLATRYYAIASEGARMNSATNQVNEIKQGVYRFMNDQPGQTPDMATLTTGGYITQATGTGGGTHTNPWSGSISVGGTSPNLTVVMSGITSTSSCANLQARFCGASPVAPCACTGGVLTVPIQQTQ